MEVFVTGMLHSFGNDNSKLRMSCSFIGIGLVNIIWGWLWYWKVMVTGMLYSFAIIIETIVVIVGVLGYGFVVGIL